MAVCETCFRRCELKEGQTGFCGGRSCREGSVTARNYGRVTALALDPIEKKPLNRFRPGSLVLSVGSYGCNLRCPFCQNADISWSKEALALAERTDYISPEDLAYTAARYRERGNLGVAFTYNEPLIGWEYVRDTAKLVKRAGMCNVLVTNGTASLPVLEELAPYIDAMNIDLKGFSEEYYRTLGGSLDMVLDFITHAVRTCHVELTTLVVPGENDSEEELRALTRWAAGLKDAGGRTVGPEIPLHITRFFPRFHRKDLPPTPIKTIDRLVEVAREQLRYVYPGNC